MQECDNRQARYLFVSPGFLLLETMVFLSISIGFVSLGLLFAARGKIELSRCLSIKQKNVKELLVLQLVLEDIAHARYAWVDAAGSIWCASVGDAQPGSLPCDVCWLRSQGNELMRRMYRGGKRLQTHCFGNVLKELSGCAQDDGRTITITWSSGDLKRILVGSYL